MTGPFRARYGAADNKHTLLDFDGKGEPPRVLLGLTDKPPGTYRPGDLWWPAVGFGPVGDSWALWCTRPDDEATRAGMVTSQVLIWPIEEIGEVEDLTPFIAQVSGEPPALPAGHMAEVVAQAIIDADQRAPVVPGLLNWPGLIATLWRQLPAADRKVFSGRVMLSPPQHGSDDRCSLFCTPDGRAAQWPADRLVDARLTEPVSRAARWLAGQEDSGVALIVQALSDQPILQRINTVARAAERLDALRTAPSPEGAILLLRPLILLAPSKDRLTELKTEALAAIAAGMEGANVGVVRSMANIDDSALPELGPVRAALTRWVVRHMPDLDAEDLVSVVDALAPGRSCEWWKQTVQAAITDHLQSLSWRTALFHWLSSPACRQALAGNWGLEGLESDMIAVAQTSDVPPSHDASGMLETCTVFGWSTLHAMMCGGIWTLCDALVRQLSFPGDSVPGLQWLVGHADGAQLVAAAVALNDDGLRQCVAGRTVGEPGLLATMNAGPAWLVLWVQHVTLGGQPWPRGLDTAATCRLLLQELDSVELTPALLHAIGDELAACILDSPKRSELWTRLPADLRRRVAQVALAKVNAGEVYAKPEEPLLGQLVAIAKAQRISAAALLLFLGWTAAVCEGDALGWVARMQWDSHAAAIGERIDALGWNRVAEALYAASWGDRAVVPAALACRHLLSSYQRIVLEFRAKYSVSFGPKEVDALDDRIVTLGATIADDRLKDFWVRAGGDVARLGLHTYPRDRWRDAVRAARHGALHGGLLSLVDQILEDYPNNEEFHNIRAILANGSPRR
ncbi:hypothetical protein HHL24_37315 [Paraburkholderia sp. RP-4-7]|uniref:Uncharacterized protein n=1 Tax=Paraburkholderia polaris TaxID=2728848 RepID=A0A848IR73_9BURK|nr:hypothetical protein [Paraburkholderia polaris]NMM03526.1 hypothetical protein [Paraburkholderia polaris]